MHNLKEIGERMLVAPTIMSAELELKFAAELMTIPLDEAAEGGKLWYPIWERLSESHEDAFYEVSPSNYARFLAFADWLEKVAAHSKGGEFGEGWKQFANLFRIKPY